MFEHSDAAHLFTNVITQLLYTILCLQEFHTVVYSNVFALWMMIKIVLTYFASGVLAWVWYTTFSDFSSVKGASAGVYGLAGLALKNVLQDIFILIKKSQFVRRRLQHDDESMMCRRRQAEADVKSKIEKCCCKKYRLELNVSTLFFAWILVRISSLMVIFLVDYIDYDIRIDTNPLANEIESHKIHACGFSIGFCCAILWLPFDQFILLQRNSQGGGAAAAAFKGRLCHNRIQSSEEETIQVLIC